jgi:hypothetical protein
LTDDEAADLLSEELRELEVRRVRHARREVRLPLQWILDALDVVVSASGSPPRR